MSHEIDITQAEYYMQECFELANKALGRTSPNPLVGAIVLDKNGNPVGKGYHEKAGSPHAECVALDKAGVLSKGGTLIVNLEPCCHIGKTPPCTEQIIKSGIKQVIFSNTDPHLPSGVCGEDVLKKNNIKIIKGLLEEEGKEINKFFLKWVKQKLPWITLKLAQTMDGKVALKDKTQRWITSDEAKDVTFQLRNTYDAVLTTASTVLADNPQLTVRDIQYSRNPVRVILDTKLQTDPSSNVYKDNAKVFLVTKKGHLPDKLNAYKKVNDLLGVVECNVDSYGLINVREVFEKLAEENILSVLIECGPRFAGFLLQERLLDQYILFLAPTIFNDTDKMEGIVFNSNGLETKPIKFSLFNYKPIGNDFMLDCRVIKE